MCVFISPSINVFTVAFLLYKTSQSLLPSKKFTIPIPPPTTPQPLLDATAAFCPLLYARERYGHITLSSARQPVWAQFSFATTATHQIRWLLFINPINLKAKPKQTSHSTGLSAAAATVECPNQHPKYYGQKYIRSTISSGAASTSVCPRRTTNAPLLPLGCDNKFPFSHDLHLMVNKLAEKNINKEAPEPPLNEFWESETYTGKLYWPKVVLCKYYWMMVEGRPWRPPLFYLSSPDLSDWQCTSPIHLVIWLYQMHHIVKAPSNRRRLFCGPDRSINFSSISKYRVSVLLCLGLRPTRRIFLSSKLTG